MIRLNFVSRPMKLAIAWQKPAIAVLSVTLFLQIVMVFSTWLEISRKEGEAERLKGRLVELEQRLEQTTNPKTDLSKLAGALLDRNQWLESRSQTPVEILFRFDKGNKPGIHLFSFEGKAGGGALKLVAADMDTASRHLAEVFHSNTDRLALENRTPEGLVLGYTWND
ncbi:MAG: hypothetical protein WA705_26300 [Candidatus Ozemobacteraceae bacterium]